MSAGVSPEVCCAPSPTHHPDTLRQSGKCNTILFSNWVPDTCPRPLWLALPCSHATTSQTEQRQLACSTQHTFSEIVLGQEALQLKAPTVILLLLCQHCLQLSHVFCQLTPVAGLLHTQAHTNQEGTTALRITHAHECTKARANPFNMESLDV